MKVYTYNDIVFNSKAEFIKHFKNDLLVYPDAIFNDNDLYNYAFVNGYVEVKIINNHNNKLFKVLRYKKKRL